MERNTFNIHLDSLYINAVVYEILDGGVYIKDLNQFVEQTENIQRELIIGKKLLDVFPMAKDIGLYDKILQVHQSGIDDDLQLRFYDDERIQGWRENHIAKIAPNLLLVTYNDLTQEKQKEQEIYLASKVFEYSTDAIIITNTQNNIITVNDSFSKLTGYSLQEAKGKNPKLLSSGWGDKEFYKQMWHSILNDGVWRGEIWDRKKDKTLYIADESIIAVRNEEGEIENFIGISHDITMTKNQEREIRQLAYYDFLTKLPNRKFFKERVEQKLKHNTHTFALLFLDLDNFKWVNDTLGHKVGDQVLIYMSQSIQSILESSAILSRLGGDEFVIYMPYQEIITISQLAQTVIEQIQESITIDTFHIHVGCSIGISLYPQNGKNYDELLKNADLAMYSAKERGKNNYQYFNPTMNALAHQRLQLYNALKKAIAEEEFELYYQPKITCTTGEIKGAETLIRWHSSELGAIGPDIFIPVAEETGLIGDIGDWVLEQAMKDIHGLIDEGFCNIKIAVNVSIQQLEKPDFITKLSKLLAQYAIPTNFLELEVTESTLMSNIQELSDVISTIHALGIDVAIDDFGTGYSSLQYLNKLSFNTIKIDKAFIDNIEKEGKVIVEAIMALSHTMKFQTVAEGVETIEQATILRELHCSMIQGYLYAKPQPLHAFKEYYRTRLSD